MSQIHPLLVSHYRTRLWTAVGCYFASVGALFYYCFRVILMDIRVAFAIGGLSLLLLPVVVLLSRGKMYGIYKRVTEIINEGAGTKGQVIITKQTSPSGTVVSLKSVSGPSLNIQIWPMSLGQTVVGSPITVTVYRGKNGQSPAVVNTGQQVLIDMDIVKSPGKPVSSAAGVVAPLVSLVMVFAVFGVLLATMGSGSKEKLGTLLEERKKHPTVLIKKTKAPGDVDNTPPANVSVVHYNSAGRKLMAWLAMPKAPGKHPVVMFAHGGWTLSKADFPPLRTFLNKGYAVMVPAWRAENGNAGDFEMCFGEVDDAVAAINYLASNPKVDPERIYAAGHSSGGTLVTLLAEVCPKVRKVAACGAYVNMTEHGPYDDAPFDKSRRMEVVTRSPAEFAFDLKCPLLLLFGSDEGGYIGLAERMKDSLSMDVNAEKSRRAELPEAKRPKNNADLEAKQISVQVIDNADHFTALDRAIFKMCDFFGEPQPAASTAQHKSTKNK